MSPATLRRIRDYVDSHLDHNIDLKSLAATAELSPYHFARTFKQTEGTTPHMFVLERRLAKARELLTRPDLSLADVALAWVLRIKVILAVAFAKRSAFLQVNSENCKINALRLPDPSVALALNNLAVLYLAQGRYAEAAEALHKRALAIREKALGPDHADVALSLNNLAALYVAQGRYAEAEPLYKRSLAIQEKALGPDHPDVGTSLNNLAGLYTAQGRYGEAEVLEKRSLAIQEKALGPDHLDVGASLSNLAGLYLAQGRFAEAEPLSKPHSVQAKTYY